jgi:putative ABC transport system permease protein
MLRNYFKIAFRHLVKYKVYSFINIAGLAIGIAACLLIVLWVYDELSYDRFNTNVDRIYRVFEENATVSPVFRSVSTPIGLAPRLQNDYPEIQFATRFKRGDRTLVQCNEKSFMEDRFCIADAELFKIFTVCFIHGNPETAFQNPYSLVITKRISQKYFGPENPVGKSLRVGNQLDFTVTGVVENLPHNSTIQFDLLVPFSLLGSLGLDLNSLGFYDQYETYFLVRGNASVGALGEGIAGIIKEYDPRRPETLGIQVLTKAQLFGLAGDGKLESVVIFSLLAAFILLIACINFMNLTTARAETRSKEIGMRKAAGASRRDLIKQFLGESIVMSLISGAFALGIVELTLPLVNQLSGKQMRVGLNAGLEILAGFFLIILLAGLISGSYPALALSSFSPSRVLRSSSKSGTGRRVLLRKILVIIQFSITIALLVGILMLNKQMNFIHGKDLGYNRENVVYFPLHEAFKDRYHTFETVLLEHPGIISVSAASQIPTNILSETSDFEWDGKNPNEKIYVFFSAVDHKFLETFDMSLVEGRSFSRDMPTDAGQAVVLNQTAAKLLGEGSPIGKRFSVWGRKSKVVGVVKDFNFHSLHKKVKPLAMFIEPAFFQHMFVRIKPENMNETIGYVEEIWKDVAPGFPFEYHFLDEAFGDLYKGEQGSRQLLSCLTYIAIFISCLGLFGLTSFSTQQRTKEIGIRKVLGATVASIVYMLSKEFLLLVGFANLIAWPVAYFAMNHWLRGFAYRIDVSWGTFVLAGAMALFIALATVSFQAVKAALANPVEALRYE